jgi:hypothetical protein
MGITLLLLVMMLMTLEVQKMCSFVTETAEGEEGGVSNTETVSMVSRSRHRSGTKTA